MRSPSACSSPRSRAAARTSLSAGDLLAHGTVVWLTNIITFGLLFWQLDEGGPRLRAERGRPDPDFEFPQDAVPRAGWSPRLSDYLYVSLTNAIAVSPTDTMPLTRRAKGLHGRRVADLLRRGDPRRRPRRERPRRERLTTTTTVNASGRASSWTRRGGLHCACLAAFWRASGQQEQTAAATSGA